MRHLISRSAVGPLALAFAVAGLTSASAQVPVITGQPQSTNVVLGYGAAFSVSATNPPLGYQWRKESVPISGATGSTLSLSSVKYSAAGNYSVLVSNAYGIVASSNAILTVTPPAAGELDLAFNPGADSVVYCLALQADGRILVGGGFTNLGGQTRYRICRLNPDGTLDGGFNPGASYYVRSLAVQADGKILVGGEFTNLGGQTRYRIGRLNPDGTLDTGFNPDANGYVYSIAVQADGKILVGGEFTALGGQTRNRIGRLNPDGTLDSGFNPGASLYVRSLAVQADGKILVGGEFTALGGQTRNCIGRLNPDGTLDTAFNPGANSIVYCLALQADGKILVGGTFTNLGGQMRYGIGRLNPDGTLDTAFNPGGDRGVYSLAVQADGKILLAGNFTTLGGQTRNRIGRLNPDGTLDSGFNPGANLAVHSLAVQADGKILVGGWFTTLGGQPRNRIARLYGAADIYDLTDADGDGLPSLWERQQGLDPEVPNRQMGTGRDGPLSVEVGDYYTDEVWARVLGNNPAGIDTLNVSTTNGFTVSNLVLVITMQDPTTNLTQNTAGTYEFGRIAALNQTASLTNLVLTAPRSNAFTVTTSEKIQVLKVPEYTDVTLTGSTLQFDGTNQCVTGAPAGLPLGNSPYTIEAWIKPDEMSDKGGIIGWGNYGTGNQVNAFRLTTTPTNGLANYWWGNDLRATTGPLTGAWHHVAATFDGTTRRILLDGGVISQDTPGAHNVLSVANFAIGRTDPGFSEYFPGKIDEVRIWNVGLSPTVISNNMHRALTGEEPGLVAYYRFNEGTGSTAHDATPNHFDVTLANAPVWVSSGSLTCHPWNGTNGGVLAFLTHSVTLSGQGVISADGKGYRGGPDYTQADADGYQGESFTGSWPVHSITNNYGGGGGGGRSYQYIGNSGGGGGYGSPGAIGLVTPGNVGHNDRPTALVPAFGGSGYATTTVARLFMGSGGGSGGQDGDNLPGDGYSNGGVGGAGGGIVLCFASILTNQGVISASGQDGSSQIEYERGVGGGGAGGGIWIGTAQEGASGMIRALGGSGGSNNFFGNPYVGGPGGVGRVRLDVPASGAVPAGAWPAPGCQAQLSASNGVTDLIWGDYLDNDNDGLDDWQEYIRGTLANNPDTDGDGTSDGWEAANGLNPLNAADAALDSDGDGVANVVEFQRGTDPGSSDSDGDGLTDYQELFVYHTDPRTSNSVPSATGHRYYYDPLDRLVGVDYTNGLSLLYAYDGNDNLVRQAYLAGDANANGVPDAWEQSQGLTNGIFADTDGDGSPDGQEWSAGTDPVNSNSVPLDPLGPAGSNITGGIVFPFTPSNYVVAVGQLDGIGAEEIVVSADGDPGTTTNFLVILSQTVSGWSTQRVDVGPFGVTSLAVGQPANRDVPAIYLGLRQPGGTGSVVEVSSTAVQWALSTLARSTNDAAYVLGARPGRDVMVSLAQTNGPAGTPYYLSFAANVWTLTRADTNTSAQRGLGIVTLPGLHTVTSRGVRLLDAGGLQVLGDEGFVPTNAIWNPAYSRWFFKTTNSTTWEACQSYAQLFGGNLATVTDTNLNTWLCEQFTDDFWIGLRREFLYPPSGPWRWASGLPVTYANWRSGQPNEVTECVAKMNNPGYERYTWDDYATTIQSFPGVAETAGFVGCSLLTNEPAVFSRLPWRGHSLCAGDLRLSGAVSILYASIADQNRDNVLDAGDELMLTEYLFDGTNVLANDIQRIPLTGTVLAPSYGLACVDVLCGNQQALFTAEPDGRIFSWSATNGTTALQRQLFSAHDQGMAWHALARVRTLERGQSLVGLRVDPATPDRCDVILWPPVSQLSAPPDYAQTAPITQILPVPNAGTNQALVDIRLWDGEANPARVTLQYQRPYETTWRPATIDLAGYLATYPTGITHTVTWDAALDLGPGFTNTVQLRARAQDISLVGNWSGAVSYQLTTLVGNNPHAYDDTAITAMNQAVDIDVLANDTVENSAPKLIYSVQSPSDFNGTVVTNLNSTVRYTPAPGFVGTDQFTYWLTDGAAYSEATVTVTVTPGVVVLEVPTLDTNWFGLLITGPAGAYQVLASTNLNDWSPLGWATNTTGTVPYAEQVPTNSPARFYRALLVQ